MMADQEIRVVAFDAVGTLMYPWPSVSGIYADIASRHGSELSESEIRSRFPAAMGAFDRDALANNYQTSEARERELWRTVVATVLTDVDELDDCFGEMFEWFARPEAWRLFDDVAETLRGLSERRIPIVIASNFDHRLNAVCDGFEELQPLTTRCISSEVGFRKPSSGYYDRLSAMCDCDRGHILMVGDTPDNDVTGAIEAGLQAVLIDRNSESDFPHRISSLTQVAKLIDA